MEQSALAGVGSCLQKGPALSDIHQFVRIAQIKRLNSNCVLVLMFHLSLLPVHLGQKRQFSVRPLPCGQHSVRSQPGTLLASVHYSALALKLLYLSSPKMKTSTAPFFDLNGTPRKWKGHRGELWIFVTNKLTASPKPLSPLHGTLRLTIWSLMDVFIFNQHWNLTN